MNIRRLLFGVVATAALALPARAALVLEFVSITQAQYGGPLNPAVATGPALTSLFFPTATSTLFVEVMLRDTLAVGRNIGQPGTVAWQTNMGNAGPGSLGFYGFYFDFEAFRASL